MANSIPSRFVRIRIARNEQGRHERRGQLPEDPLPPERLEQKAGPLLVLGVELARPGGERGRVALAAGGFRVPVVVLLALDEHGLLLEQSLDVRVKPQVVLVAVRQPRPRGVSLLRNLPLRIGIRIHRFRHDLAAAFLLRQRVDPILPPEELLEPVHARLELCRQTYQELPRDDLHGPPIVLLRQLAFPAPVQPVRQQPRQPVVLDVIALRVPFQRPVFHPRLRLLQVPEVPCRAFDGVAEHGEEPPPGRGGEQAIRLVHQRAHGHVGHLGVGEAHLPRPADPVDGGGVDVDEGHPLLGVDYPHAGAVRLIVLGPPSSGLDQSVASPHGRADGRAARLLHVPEYRYVGGGEGGPGVLEVAQLQQAVFGLWRWLCLQSGAIFLWARYRRFVLRHLGLLPIDGGAYRLGPCLLLLLLLNFLLWRFNFPSHCRYGLQERLHRNVRLSHLY
mmetsp:Transcript_30496/g.64799  ORF Transcript_30496/g.64799 Transcript_30496/m.64799 type:complete len:447 (-) Transcript_30496:288-1628(-)